jgi:hypothetical protein
MLILTDAGTDKLQLVTSAAASIDVHADWADVNPNASPIIVTPGRTNTAIVTAATTDIVAKPATSFTRNVKALTIRNKSASLSCDVTVLYNANASTFEMHKATLIPGAVLEFIEGIGFFTISSAINNLTNESTSNQTLSTADVYLAGSSVAVPANLPVVGTAYRLVISMSKTAGTGTQVITIRYGTAGAIGDTARCTLTFGVGTTVADTATWNVLCLFRSVGSGTAAVIQGSGNFVNNLAVTGFAGATPVKAAENTGGGFDSTVANSFIGASFNGSTAFAGTATVVRAELIA